MVIQTKGGYYKHKSSKHKTAQESAQKNSSSSAPVSSSSSVFLPTSSSINWNNVTSKQIRESGYKNLSEWRDSFNKTITPPVIPSSSSVVKPSSTVLINAKTGEKVETVVQTGGFNLGSDPEPTISKLNISEPTISGGVNVKTLAPQPKQVVEFEPVTGSLPSPTFNLPTPEPRVVSPVSGGVTLKSSSSGGSSNKGLSKEDSTSAAVWGALTAVANASPLPIAFDSQGKVSLVAKTQIAPGINTNTVNVADLGKAFAGGAKLSTKADQSTKDLVTNLGMTGAGLMGAGAVSVGNALAGGLTSAAVLSQAAPSLAKDSYEYVDRSELNKETRIKHNQEVRKRVEGRVATEGLDLPGVDDKTETLTANMIGSSVYGLPGGTLLTASKYKEESKNIFLEQGYSQADAERNAQRETNREVIMGSLGELAGLAASAGTGGELAGRGVSKAVGGLLGAGTKTFTVSQAANVATVSGALGGVVGGAFESALMYPSQQNARYQEIKPTEWAFNTALGGATAGILGGIIARTSITHPNASKMLYNALGALEGGQEFVGDRGASMMVGNAYDLGFNIINEGTKQASVKGSTAVSGLVVGAMTNGNSIAETPGQAKNFSTVNAKGSIYAPSMTDMISNTLTSKSGSSVYSPSVGESIANSFAPSTSKSSSNTKSRSRGSVPSIVNTPGFTPSNSYTPSNSIFPSAAQTPSKSNTPSTSKSKTKSFVNNFVSSPSTSNSPLPQNPFTPSGSLEQGFTPNPNPGETASDILGITDTSKTNEKNNQSQMTNNFSFTATPTQTYTPTFTGKFMPFIPPIAGDSDGSGKASKRDKSRFIDEFSLAFAGLATPSQPTYFGKEKPITMARKMYKPKRKSKRPGGVNYAALFV
jgi:hypothetical protein